jgi:hypothetical protein
VKVREKEEEANFRLKFAWRDKRRISGWCKVDRQDDRNIMLKNVREAGQKNMRLKDVREAGQKNMRPIKVREAGQEKY